MVCCISCTSSMLHSTPCTGWVGHTPFTVLSEVDDTRFKQLITNLQLNLWSGQMISRLVSPLSVCSPSVCLSMHPSETKFVSAITFMSSRHFVKSWWMYKGQFFNYAGPVFCLSIIFHKTWCMYMYIEQCKKNTGYFISSICCPSAPSYFCLIRFVSRIF